MANGANTNPRGCPLATRERALPAPGWGKCCRQCGFSLLEVLVAFSIMALLLTALLQVFAAGLRSAALGDQYTRATLLAESKFAALGVEIPLVEGEEQGASDGPYHWRLRLEPYWPLEAPQAVDLSVRPVLATVEVYWEEGNRQRVISLTTLRLAPQP